MTGSPSGRSLSVVWFKRDLRVSDHQPLVEAAKQGPVLPLYVYEPELLRSDCWDPSHSVFIDESLAELERALSALGAPLVYRLGALPAVFEALWQQTSFGTLMSHRETGNQITYQRDLRVADWCRQRGVRWREFNQTGVIRKLRRREGWAARWRARMEEATQPVPSRLEAAVGVQPEQRRSLTELGLGPSARREAQHGGESNAQQTLRSFLRERGVNYRADMASPVTGWEGCSRISPYLAWGNLSMRQVFQASQHRIVDIKARSAHGIPEDKRWLSSLSSFQSRLSWHCHFMQKLEDEPRIEFDNMQRACDGLRENAFRDDYFAAWCEGKTGYPMVDACMRCLAATGWLNFRMRAMVMSFASYHLWLHWRPTAIALAHRFVDFEPGIHFSQAQMQSGTTGINALRIYSPAKQAQDNDPQGVFIRRWVPELAAVPLEYLAEPQKMPADEQRTSRCRLGVDYPEPIVEHRAAYAAARKRMGALRNRPEARQQAHKVYAKHGSRKRAPQTRRR